MNDSYRKTESEDQSASGPSGASSQKTISDLHEWIHFSCVSLKPDKLKKKGSKGTIRKVVTLQLWPVAPRSLRPPALCPSRKIPGGGEEGAGGQRRERRHRRSLAPVQTPLTKPDIASVREETCVD
ncbi:unnamed protein product [Pleuronectes platessa]|uniref:Uncharacterized protein n=1 Tax=Pleuronectes platessa TaxID=8262 RepID=A0A9N7YFG8_PLEPL|nr:unnamed protein product [Pleuronectes platessa]